MSKKYEVIKAFHLPIDAQTLKNLENTHTYISDKLILDAVNGVNVVARDLHEVNKSRQSFSTRTFDGLSGSSRKRQDLINENLIEGLTACTEWLCDHDRHMSRVDNKIGILANELNRTQDEILKFYEQHTKLKNIFDEFQEVFFKFEQSANKRISYLHDYIQSIDVRTKGMDLIDLELSRLNANKYEHLTIPLQVYSVLDNIKSGYGGIYYDSITDEKEKVDFQERIENELISHYKGKCDLTDLVSYEQLLEDVDRIEADVLSFISIQHYNEMIENNLYPEVSDIISIVTSFKNENTLKEIEEQSNIRTFFTYEDYIKTALNEHLQA